MKISEIIVEAKALSIPKGVAQLPKKIVIGKGLYLELSHSKPSIAYFTLKHVFDEHGTDNYFSISKRGTTNATYMLQAHGPGIRDLTWDQRSKKGDFDEVKPFDLDTFRNFARSVVALMPRETRLAEDVDGKPVIVSMLYKLHAANKVVFYVAPLTGVLRLREIHKVGPEEKFSENAPSDIAGTSYTAVHFKPEGYYSWEKADIGSGWGDGSFGLPHVNANQWHIARLPSVQGRTDFVLGRKSFVNRWKLQHEAG